MYVKTLASNQDQNALVIDWAYDAYSGAVWALTEDIHKKKRLVRFKISGATDERRIAEAKIEIEMSRDFQELPTEALQFAKLAFTGG